MPAPSAIRKKTKYSGSPSMGIEISRPEAKTHDYHQRSPSRSRPVPLSRSQTPRYFPDQPLERSRSNDRRYDDEYSTRDEYGDDLRDNNDDYSTTAEEEKPGGFGFSAKFFCCDSTMSWGISLGKEDEDTEQLGESEKNAKRGIIPHFPQRGRSLTRTTSFLRGRSRSLSRTDERRGRSHSRSRSFSGAIKGIMRSRSGGISPSRTRSWTEAEVSNHRDAPSQYEYFDDDDGTHTSNKSNHCSIKSSKSTSTAKKFKGLFSKQSRKKSSNKETAPSIAPTKSCDESIFSSLTETEVDRLKSQLEDLKKAEEERRRQAELLEVAMNATNEEEKRTFAEAAALAADAATKALEDEETKRAAGALLAHQMEEDHKASLDQNNQEEEREEEISLDTTISKDSTTVETVENNTSKGTDSERNEEKKRKEEVAREKKASELKKKKRKEEVAREKKASELKEKKAAQKERKRMAAKEKKAKKLPKKGQKKRAAKLAATEDHLNKDEVTPVCEDNEVVTEQPALLLTKTFDEV